MENKIDKSEFRFIDVAFIQKTDLKNGSSMDTDGIESLKHLQSIIESTKPMVKTLCLVHDEVERTYRTATDVMVNNKRILGFHFMWARMALEFYYFYHDDKENALKIVEDMLSYEGFGYIKEAVKHGLRLIDVYYEKELNEKLLATPAPISLQSTPTQVTSQQPAAEPIPDLIQIIQDIDSGKKRWCDVDWEPQLKDILALSLLMPVKYPYILVLWGILGEIKSPSTRNDVLNRLIDVAPNCFASVPEKSKFIEDCHCLIQINMRLTEAILHGKDGIRHFWTDERKSLNDLAFLFSDKCVKAEDLVALAEEMYSRALEGENNYMLTLVLHANRQKGKLSVNNIFDFAKNLYIAENFRRHLLKGEAEKIIDLPVLSSLDTKLLKGCFDEYIRLRNVKIKDSIERDLAHYGDANELECLEQLYNHEQQVVEKINKAEGYCDNPCTSYNAMWAPGRKTVLDIVNKFLQYLQGMIQSKRKAEVSTQTVAPIITQSVTIEQNYGQINSIDNSEVNVNK